MLLLFDNNYYDKSFSGINCIASYNSCLADNVTLPPIKWLSDNIIHRIVVVCQFALHLLSNYHSIKYSRTTITPTDYDVLVHDRLNG